MPIEHLGGAGEVVSADLVGGDDDGRQARRPGGVKADHRVFEGQNAGRAETEFGEHPVVDFRVGPGPLHVVAGDQHLDDTVAD